MTHMRMQRDAAVVPQPVLLPRMTVGVMGSAGGSISDGIRRVLRDLGRAIAQRGHVLITGACPGLPHEAVAGAKEIGGFVVGISPGHNLEEHVTKYRSPTFGYDTIIYTGSGLMGREIENIRSCDVVVFAGGRSGTLGEFAIAYEEGKVIGVLEGTGGLADSLGTVIEIVKKETKAVVCYESAPYALMDKLEGVYKARVLPHYMSVLHGRNPHGELDP